MANIGVAVAHHDLLAVGAARLVAMADELHVACVARLDEMLVGHEVDPQETGRCGAKEHVAPGPGARKGAASQPLYSTM